MSSDLQHLISAFKTRTELLPRWQRFSDATLKITGLAPCGGLGVVTWKLEKLVYLRKAALEVDSHATTPLALHAALPSAFRQNHNNSVPNLSRNVPGVVLLVTKQKAAP